MAKTPSDIIKQFVGDYVAQIALLQSQNEHLQEENERLKAELAEKFHSSLSQSLGGNHER